MPATLRIPLGFAGFQNLKARRFKRIPLDDPGFAEICHTTVHPTTKIQILKSSISTTPSEIERHHDSNNK
ncbi:uncharacterized protein EAE97_003063 [Botrytis byssoidea]|uniref:Uncharacterized protein n=1 Tax=Botrytis byssoidea TaxID=139641 RepID=A0A9P5IU26_9HELO|nr:uncharacterized protein EAE97_003063 [Botrytis byssoidea]KAF7949554.1 hypothetical protein EAE97_003063 [Botrytis byssoidea]